MKELNREKETEKNREIKKEGDEKKENVETNLSYTMSVQHQTCHVSGQLRKYLKTNFLIAARSL